MQRLRRAGPFAITLIVLTVFGLGLLIGDWLRYGPVREWWEERHTRAVYREFERRAEEVQAEIPPEIEARIVALEELGAAKAPKLDAGAREALILLDRLRFELGMYRKHEWKHFVRDSSQEPFRPVGPMDFEDLPEPARETVDALVRWHATTPRASWGNFGLEDEEIPNDALGFLCDIYQSALREVIPPDHAYWDALLRIFVATGHLAPGEAREGILYSRFSDTEKCRELYREYGPRASDTPYFVAANARGYLAPMLIGLSDYDFEDERAIYEIPEVDWQKVELRLRILEAVAATRVRGEPMSDSIAGLPREAEATTYDHLFNSYLSFWCVEGDFRAAMDRWVDGKGPLPPLGDSF